MTAFVQGKDVGFVKPKVRTILQLLDVVNLLRRLDSAVFADGPFHQHESTEAEPSNVAVAALMCRATVVCGHPGIAHGPASRVAMAA